MTFKSAACLTILFIFLAGSVARADQIVLKDGSTFSGTFVRGDSENIEFRILGNIVSFNITDLVRINFEAVGSKSTVESKSAVNPARGNSPVKESAAVTSRVPEKSKTAPIVTGTGIERKAEPKLVPRPSQTEAARTAKAAPVTVPSGTLLTIRTTEVIDTEQNKAGDAFHATLDEDLVFDEKTIAPRGSAVKGRIAYAKESGKLTGQSELILELTELLINNKSYLLRTSDYTEVGANRSKRTATTVGGVAAVGAIIGAIAGGGKGAAIGAASGAALGTGVQVITKGQTLKIPAETILEFRLQYPLTLE